MYISWRRRKLVGGDWYPSDDAREHWAIEAAVSRSRRENGVPRREHVGVIGHIDEAHLDHPAHRFAFWYTATNRLAAISIADSERAEIETTLAGKIPPVVLEDFAPRERWLALYLVDWEAAAAALNDLCRVKAIAPDEATFRRGVIEPAQRARHLGRQYHAARIQAHIQRRQIVNMIANS